MNTNANSPRAMLSNPWAFFALALGWSWLFWFVAILLGLSIETPLGGSLALLGLLGPLVAGVTGAYLTQDKEGRRDYWLRVIDPKRIKPRWYVALFLFVPVLIALSAWFDKLVGGNGAAWEEPALRFFAAPWTIIPFALSTFLIGPMEEFGWRGYVLDRLQDRWNALVSSLILGIVWSLWHLPLFYFKDTYQFNLEVGSQAFWLFMFGIVPLTVVFSWIFNHTRRSTLGAMLFHFMVNFVGQLVALTPRAEFYSIVLWTIAAIMVTAIWGARTLTRTGELSAHRAKTAQPTHRADSFAAFRRR
jgi:membrane protease YdiL (CAAX protease family)